MTSPTPLFVTAAVEGDLNEAVLTKLLASAGAILHRAYGKKGKPHLRANIGA